jgi:APA family basic amino acid/polyamine antiporter
MLARGTKESASMNAAMVLIKLAILAFFVVVAFSGFEAKNFVPFINTDNSKGFAGMVGITGRGRHRVLLVHRPRYRRLRR